MTDLKVYKNGKLVPKPQRQKVIDDAHRSRENPWGKPVNVNPTKINNKITVLEHLSAKNIVKESKETVIDEFKTYDKDLRTLTYRVLLNKFNDKYDNLLEGQKSILKELITSIDNTPRLKEFYNTKVKEIKTSLTGLNEGVKDKATQIKIEEVVKILPTIGKTSKVKDDDLINLLQYYDLIEELKTTNVQVQA